MFARFTWLSKPCFASSDTVMYCGRDENQTIAILRVFLYYYMVSMKSA